MLNILPKITRLALVVPASSAESERHFSIAGQLENEQRSALDPECVEALVVLKEVYIKKMGPAKIEVSKEPSQSSNVQSSRRGMVLAKSKDNSHLSIFSPCEIVIP